MATFPDFLGSAPAPNQITGESDYKMLL